MKLPDILPIEKWVELENEINRISGLDSNVFDVNGIKITDNKNWANRLCPLIKANKKGQSFICAVANINVAAQAMHTKKAAIEECDAGLVKIAIPIFVNDEFIGSVGTCGLLLDDSEVESFLINRITGIEEEEIKSLSDDINRITRYEAESLGKYIEKEIDTIVRDFEKQQPFTGIKLIFDDPAKDRTTSHYEECKDESIL